MCLGLTERVKQHRVLAIHVPEWKPGPRGPAVSWFLPLKRASWRNCQTENGGEGVLPWELEVQRRAPAQPAAIHLGGDPRALTLGLA